MVGASRPIPELEPARAAIRNCRKKGRLKGKYTPLSLPFILSAYPGQVSSVPGLRVGWALFSTAFSIYFRYFKNFTVTYGSLAAVILMMLWLYFCICILFMGAEINWWWELHAPSRNWSRPGQP